MSDSVPRLLSDTQIRSVFSAKVLRLLDVKGVERDTPRVVFIVGQPGAGKNKVEAAVKRKMAMTSSAIRLDLDEFREHHPSYDRLLGLDDTTAASKVQEDTEILLELAVSHCIQKRFDLVIHGTFKNESNARSTISRFRASNYEVRVAGLGVDYRNSALSVAERYMIGKNSADGHGRYVPRSVQSAAYSGLVHSVSRIENDCMRSLENMCSPHGLSIHMRDSKTVYARPRKVPTRNRHTRAYKALGAARKIDYLNEIRRFAVRLGALVGDPDSPLVLLADLKPIFDHLIHSNSQSRRPEIRRVSRSLLPVIARLNERLNA